MEKKRQVHPSMKGWVKNVYFASFYSRAFHVGCTEAGQCLHICAHPLIFWSESQQEADDNPYRVIEESPMKGLL